MQVLLDFLIIILCQIKCHDNKPNELASFLPDDLKKQNCREQSLLAKLDLCFSPHLMTFCTKLVYKTVEAELHFSVPICLLYIHQQFPQKQRSCCRDNISIHSMG